MQDKIKNWIFTSTILGIILGRIINRVLSNHFGDKASNTIVALLVTIIFCVILLLITMAQYIIAIMLFIMSIPLIISGIGLYLNNMNLVGIGIFSIFIIYPILIKVITKLKKR